MVRSTLIRRSLFASLIVGAVLCLPDLASTAEWIAGYAWERDEEAPYCQRVQWKQVSPERIPGLCSGREGLAVGVAACALNCLVVSKYSESEADQVDVGGETLRDHERRHILKRMRHPS